MRQEIIQRVLRERTADSLDSRAVAAATVRLLGQLHAEIESLVGTQAVRALHARSVHLTRSTFAWSWPPTEPASDLLSALQADLSSRSHGDALEAAEALLVAFADLLVMLIGDPLTQRLLRYAWGVPQEQSRPSQEKHDE